MCWRHLETETAEARWRDLYTGLEEALGTDRADTLMSRISLHPQEELATRADIDLRFQYVDQRFEEIDRRFQQVDQRFDQIDQRFQQVDQRFDKLESAIGRLHDRVDRLQLTLIGGMLAIIAAIILQTIFG